MKTKRRKGSSYPAIYVLVDKRGTILEHSSLRKATIESAEIPINTIWRNRVSAKYQRDAIKKNMTKEVWETWKFRVVKYNQETKKKKYTPCKTEKTKDDKHRYDECGEVITDHDYWGSASVWDY